MADFYKPLEYQALLNVKSVQMAGLISITLAGINTEGMKVNIYTDSCYAFRVAHDLGML